MHCCRMIFITGTDTGVGKTVLTCLLVAHLRRNGCNALAIKPFCSGARTDVTLLRSLQDRALATGEINPFWFKEPVAPLVAAQKHRRHISLANVLAKIRSIARRCECLLIEGIGGVLVPLGVNYSALDLITRSKPRVLVVAPNKLGTLNHTLLTVQALRAAGIQSLKIVLMHSRARDMASRSNAKVLSRLVAPTPLFCVPFLGSFSRHPVTLRRMSIRLAPTLDAILC